MLKLMQAQGHLVEVGAAIIERETNGLLKLVGRVLSMQVQNLNELANSSSFGLF